MAADATANADPVNMTDWKSDTCAIRPAAGPAMTRATIIVFQYIAVAWAGRFFDRDCTKLIASVENRPK